MTLLDILEKLNYGLVMLFGFFLSVDISGGCREKKKRLALLALALLLLLVQLGLSLGFGVEQVRRIYPFLVHVPLVLALIFLLKKSFAVSAVSVFTAYLCCQLPRWLALAVEQLSASALMGEVGYTVAICAIYLFLRRYFVSAANEAISGSTRVLLLFGGLPFVYYLFDYAATVYSDALYSGVPVMTEFISTALAVFYLAFLTSYHAQTQKRDRAEMERRMLNAALKQSGAEISTLRRVEKQSAVYQHDMRHHLSAIEAFLSAGKSREAEEYIKKVQSDIEAITPMHFCENELVNLLCSSYAGKAEPENICFSVDARLPQRLSISDTELCSLVSNALENAFKAVEYLEREYRWVKFYCSLRSGNLLMEVKNPYAGEIAMRDGMPCSEREGHGYGCRSIKAVVDAHRGMCVFEAEGGVFTLRVVIPEGESR